MNSLKWNLLAAGGILVICCPQAWAAALPFGQTQTGAINSVAQSNSYTFNASANDVVTLTAVTTSGNLSPKVQLYSPAGGLLAVRPSTCFGSSATVELATAALPASGTYTVLVGDCGNTNTGSYLIYAQRTNNPAGAAALLFGGQPQTGTISSAAQSNSYTFSTNANDMVNLTIVTTSGNLSPKIRLFSPAGGLLAIRPSTCFGSPTTVQLSSGMLPASGTYTVLVGDCGDTNTGNYNLAGQCFGACPAASPSSAPSLSSLSPSSANAGGSAFVLTVNGSGFLSGSTVMWNGSPLPTTYVSGSQLTASVSASLIASQGSASVTVQNLDGTTSNALAFTISPRAACTPTGLLIQTVNPPSGFAAPAGQPFNIEVLLADNCGIVSSGTVSVTFSNDDPLVNLTSLGQGNFAGTWAPLKPAQGGVVMQISAIEAVGPGRFLSAQVAISGSILSAQPQHLVTSVAALNFSLSQGGSPASQPLSILNQGSGTAAFTVQASGGAWLTVDSSSGSASTSAPATVNVTVNPGNLAPGTYSGQILVQSGTQVLPPVTVSVTVSPAQPILLLSQTALSFTIAEGGGAPLPQDFGILNVGQGAMNWTAAASSTGAWLSLDSTTGTVGRPYLDISPVNAGVNPASLTAGTYYGQIQVTVPGFDNLLQTISVVLTVLPRGSSPGPEVRPSGLIFAGPQSASPGAQTVMVSNPNARSALFNSAAITLPGVSTWFANTPASTTIASGQPAQISVQPDFSRLSPGASRGAITLLFDDGTTRTIALLAVIPPSSGSGGSLRSEASGCTPTQLNILPSGSQQILTASIGQPITLDVRVVDSCGQPVTSAAVNASFTNGDSSRAMVHVGNGRWTATWQPQKAVPAGTPAAVHVVAFVGVGLTVLSYSLDIPVTFSAPSSVPIVNSGGVVSAASFAGSTAIAPGSLIAIFGANLGNGSTGQSAAAPLPVQLGGTQVLLAGRPLPIVFASDGQINAQAPYDLPVNVPSQLVVQAGNALSVPEPVLLAPAQPAIFSDQSGQGKIFKLSTNQLADGNAPATAGDALVIYCTGLGAVNPPVAPGTGATGATPTVQPVTVTIDGKPARVDYAGLTPGFPGLYQVNTAVPTGIAASSQVPVVLSTAGQTSPAVSIAVR